MIRTINASFGPMFYAVCDECKTDALMTAGVQHREDAINAAYPSGWMTEIVRDMANRPMQRCYCPRCSVSPEYRA